LAQLHAASLGQGLHLIDAGCRDLRVYHLQESVAAYLEQMTELMAQQTTPSPAPLPREELRKLGAQLADALVLLDNTNIPNALGHLDLNPANVLVHNGSCVFLDWAEAFVGHPFLTLPYLFEHLRRSSGSDGAWGEELVCAYARIWRLYYDEEIVTRALSLAPLLAAYTYAISICHKEALPQSLPPETAKLLRSLTRRMKREADLCWERRLVCLA